MAAVAQTLASLRMFGDDLHPADVTRVLGAEPTKSGSKGDVRAGASGRQYIAKSGSWHFTAADQSPGNLDAQIKQILAALTEDLSVWADLSSRFRIDISCGLFMREENEGLEIGPDTLLEMGQRGIMLSLDIYGHAPD